MKKSNSNKLTKDQISKIAKDSKNEISNFDELKKDVLTNISKEKNDSLDQLNFDSLKDKLDNINITSIKGKNKSDFMYKFQLLDKISYSEQKKLRTKIRRKLQNYSDSILLGAKQYQIKKDIETKKELTDQINNFLSFYKETYILNDLSLNSIYRNNSNNDAKEKELKIMIDIIKISLSLKDKDSKEIISYIDSIK